MNENRPLSRAEEAQAQIRAAAAELEKKAFEQQLKLAAEKLDKNIGYNATCFQNAAYFQQTPSQSDSGKPEKLRSSLEYTRASLKSVRDNYLRRKRSAHKTALPTRTLSLGSCEWTPPTEGAPPRTDQGDRKKMIFLPPWSNRSKVLEVHPPSPELHLAIQGQRPHGLASVSVELPLPPPTAPAASTGQQYAWVYPDTLHGDGAERRMCWLRIGDTARLPLDSDVPVVGVASAAHRRQRHMGGGGGGSIGGHRRTGGDSFTASGMLQVAGLDSRRPGPAAVTPPVIQVRHRPVCMCPCRLSLSQPLSLDLHSHSRLSLPLSSPHLRCPAGRAAPSPSPPALPTHVPPLPRLRPPP